MLRITRALLAGVSLLAGPAGAAPTGQRPNVLIVLIDDHPFNFTSVHQASHVATPNMERLAARGTWFARAYNDAPICCASRTAILTGVHSTRSGVYYNNHAYRRTPEFISRVQTLPGHFKANGYRTIGYGKIAHNSFLADDVGDYSPGDYKYMNNPQDVTHPEDELMRHIIPGSRCEIPGQAAQNWTWGILPDDWDREDPSRLQQDTEQANRTIAVLRQPQPRPFLMICGFYRPHGPWTVAQRYYDRFPLDSIQLPAGFRADDLEDLPKPGRWIATNRGEHAEVVAAAMWKRCIQAISASTAYIDEQIGRVLDALERSEHRNNTIVVFAGDNGFHTGEKNHWLKFALWEQTCRVVFSISAPGMPVQLTRSPVSLLDIYPTLNALCGLPAPSTHTLDGSSLAGMVAGKQRQRGAPVLSTYGRGNHSLRDDRYRYIRYRNGDEEFYDHENDPHEWTNLAGSPTYAAAKAALAKWFPTVEAPDIAKPLPALKHATWEDVAFEK
jgi:arylsulfatase A-like enzyme